MIYYFKIHIKITPTQKRYTRLIRIGIYINKSYTVIFLIRIIYCVIDYYLTIRIEIIKDCENTNKMF